MCSSEMTLIPFDPEIERTTHVLKKEIREETLNDGIPMEA